MARTISSDFYIGTNNGLSLSVSNSAFREYESKFHAALELDNEFPIFLDTNILLGYYGMSGKEKEKLRKYISDNIDRFYITKEIEKEFHRNRVSTIESDLFTSLRNLPADYSEMKKKIINLFTAYCNDNRTILENDYNDLWKEVNSVKNEIERLLNSGYQDKIKKLVDGVTEINKNIILVDDWLALISNLKCTPALANHEQIFLMHQFEQLSKTHTAAKDHLKWRHAFPGCGEKKADPYGDFIIYHEILKFISDKKVSCIFLTNDTTKGDWMRLDKRPHLHYIENTYLLTQKLIFIIHAERALENISFENIHAKLEIIKAIYGNFDANKTIDITEILKSKVVGNRLDFIISNELGGDPYPGGEKKLRVEFKVGTIDCTLTSEEGCFCSLPDEVMGLTDVDFDEDFEPSEEDLRYFEEPPDLSHLIEPPYEEDFIEPPDDLPKFDNKDTPHDLNGKKEK